MAGWGHYLAIFVRLVFLKFFISLPGLWWISTWLETQIEQSTDLDFKFKGRFFDWTSIPGMASGLTADRGREVSKGCKAPNAKVIFVDRTPCHVHNFLREGRPLVLNFISHVDEPFWTELKQFNDMARRMSWMADFLTVVIGCGIVRSKGDWAHMLNTDPVICMRHHYCIQDRKTIATFLVDAGIVGDLVYDTPTNDAERKYAAEPERIYVVFNGLVVYVGGRGGVRGGYNAENVRQFLWHLYRMRKTLDRASERQGRGRITKEDVQRLNDDDPRNPINVNKGRLTKQRSRPSPETDDGSGSGESGLSVGDDGADLALDKLAGQSILRNKHELPLVSSDIDDILLHPDDDKQEETSSRGAEADQANQS